MYQRNDLAHSGQKKGKTKNLANSGALLSENLGQLLASSASTGDFLLVCQDGEELACHKALLIARSPTFARGLASGMKESEEGRWVVRLADGGEADRLAVKELLNFIYTGKVFEGEKTNNNNNNNKMALELLDLAAQYHLPDLIEASKAAALKWLSPSNAVSTLVQLDKYSSCSSDKGKTEVLTFIKNNVNDVVESDQWTMFVRNNDVLVTEIIKRLAI